MKNTIGYSIFCFGVIGIVDGLYLAATSHGVIMQLGLGIVGALAAGVFTAIGVAMVKNEV